MVSTATTTTTVSVPVREEVLAMGTGTICAFVLLHTPATRRSYDGGMFRAQDNLVIIQIFGSRGIMTTLITIGFSLILPFASLGRGSHRLPLRSYDDITIVASAI